MQDLKDSIIDLDGYAARQFEEVKEIFTNSFEKHQEVGAAVAVYHRGQLVVDLAAGMRDRDSGLTYTRETLQPVFSVSKGITALVANILLDRGQIDLDAPVAYYWPEFAKANKSEIPVRWLLTHQCGVLGIDGNISLEQLLDWSFVVGLLAVQAPDWAPGTNHGNHAITYGFLLGEVIRRVTGLTVGQYLSREIAAPLRADVFIGLPKAEFHRVTSALLPELPDGHPILADRGPYAARALNWISPPPGPTVVNRQDVMQAEIPSAKGITNARSLARIFASMIGPVDGFRRLSAQGMNRARSEQWRDLMR